MPDIHVVFGSSRDWVDYFAAIGPMVLSGIAVVVSLLVSRRQNALQKDLANRQEELQKMLADKQHELQRTQLEQQERQLRQDLFDKRFSVYNSIGKLMAVVSQTDGILFHNQRMPHGEIAYRRFKGAKEQAEFLFGHEVISYLEEVDKTVLNLNATAGTRNDLSDRMQDFLSHAEEATHLMRELLRLMTIRRQEVFSPYLKLADNAEPLGITGFQTYGVTNSNNE